jgi:hypothetical protein
VPEVRRDQVGQPCLWNWIDENPEPLPDAESFGRWRGWLMLDPEWDDDYWLRRASVPEEWHNVAPIPPPPGCTWKHAPLPGAE